MRRFHLMREVDVSGVSGTGLVAEGVQAEDGQVAFRWRGEVRSWVLFGSMEEMISVHGHRGSTQVVWVDFDHPIELRLDRR